MEYVIKMNEYGFYEVVNKPTQKELCDFYDKKYYQNDHGDYNKIYNETELKYIESINERYYNILNKNINITNVLDIGCGEGYLLDYFHKKKCNVTGVDFSDFAITKHNNHLLQYFIKDDIFNFVKNQKNNKYDVIFLQNVLEHVLNPKECLLSIQNLLNTTSILVIRVPNDFSNLQNYLFNNDMIQNKFWVCPPEHLSYFNLNSLKKLITDCNYELLYYMADYPIDFDLMVDTTNYIYHKNLGNKEIGKKSHLKRMLIENFLNSISIDKTCEYYKAMADLGIGREIIIFIKQK